MRSAFIGVAVLGLAGCGGGDDAAKGGPAGPGAQGPVTVGYVTVQPTSVPMVTELAARTSAYETSQVRPQVSGVIEKRYFTEGSVVKKGQTLYRIDPSLYEASASQARANLHSAQATLAAAQAKADRYKPLAKIEAVSQQDYTDAEAQARQAAAAVEQARAALRTAQINVRFTRVPAPITGRIGRSLATVGALVTQNQSDPLAVIQRLDPIYVDIRQSSADLLALRRSLQHDDGVVPASASVRLRLEDGSMYGQTGTVEFAEAMVDESTGTVTLRARFPNPEGVLLPGMFVRAIFSQAVDTKAFLVPQAGVTRDPKGNASVLIVGKDNKAVKQGVTAPRTQGNKWVVTKGLNAGDKIIVQGTAKIRPNQPIKPVPADTPQKLQVKQPGDEKANAAANAGG
ncbi:efflux RND transporter periplasmic adaptor subunit [Stakelama marina]|uniref:efflux RND transporter periplasmic adaptor subunit n=1 Tax=Stakelama marina TaxID=2826939 RepID=UPI0024C3803D|nr:efflux RND transporter periplasmic adaptor subunit [Stakelama marina]